MGRPEPFTTPIKQEWRLPFYKFLRSLGETDPNPIIERTTGFEIGQYWQKGAVLLRIDDSKRCFKDVCFTVIGRIIGERFVANAMFLAGNKITVADYFEQVFGMQTRAIFLVSEWGTVKLFETPEGWLVASSPQTIP